MYMKAPAKQLAKSSALASITSLGTSVITASTTLFWHWCRLL